MKTLTLLLFLSSIFYLSDIKLKHTVDIKADKIYTDEFRNLYVISGSSFFKLNSEGKKLYEYDNNFREKISFADVKNSLRILIFYEETNKIVFLDNKLSVTGNTFNLENKDIFGKCLVAVAETGDFWVLDISNNTLIKFNSAFKDIFKKELFEISGTPDFMTTGNNTVYIKTTEGYVYVYDNLGNFYFKPEKKIMSDFQTDNNSLLYLNKQEKIFVSYKPESEDSACIKLPDTVNVSLAVKSSDRLFFSDKMKVYIAEINERKDKQ